MMMTSIEQRMWMAICIVISVLVVLWWWLEFRLFVPSSISDSEAFEIADDLARDDDHADPIPLNIFQTWHTRDLPPSIQEAVNALKANNPEFQHYLFDDQDCRTFLQKNFQRDVVDAYDCLQPGAYKADLWRYCVLYKYGGVYLDIKYMPVGKSKLMDMMGEEHFCKDLPNPRAYKQGIYNAFMICRRGNAILRKCINKCVANCQAQFYGDSPLEVTGPTMMVEFFNAQDMAKAEECYHTYFRGQYWIIYRDMPILIIHPNYRTEQSTPKYQKQGFVGYSELWRQRKIYTTPSSSVSGGFW
jgi:Glycosyltransferase sugar-binding region containing DXD motif